MVRAVRAERRYQAGAKCGDGSGADFIEGGQTPANPRWILGPYKAGGEPDKVRGRNPPDRWRGGGTDLSGSLKAPLGSRLLRPLLKLFELISTTHRASSAATAPARPQFGSRWGGHVRRGLSVGLPRVRLSLSSPGPDELRR